MSMLGYYMALQKSGAAPSTYVPLLDFYPNAEVAFSFIKLRTAYNGYCIKVRRSSDDALQDIGFVNGFLDTASLLTFVGSGNGFVHTSYDQSTNGKDRTQTNNSLQGQIVTNGVINTIYGNVCTIFPFGSGACMNFASLIQLYPDNWSMFMMYNPQPTTEYVLNPLFYDGVTNGGSVGISWGQGGFQLTYKYPNDTNTLVSVTYNRFVECKVYNNSTEIGNNIAPNSYNSFQEYPATRSAGWAIFYDRELIIYRNNQIANREAIDTIIKNNYGI